MEKYDWDERAIDMVRSRYWYNEVLGIEYEFSETFDEDYRVLSYGHTP